MKPSILLTLLVFCGGIAFAQTPQSSTKRIGEGLAPGRVLVKFTREAFLSNPAPAIFGAAVEEYDIRGIGPWLNPALIRYGLPFYKTRTESPLMGLLRIMVVTYNSGDSPRDVARALNAMPGVEYAEPVNVHRLLYTPNDPEITRQWYLDLIKAKQAWDVVRADSTVTIAVIDTGIELVHEDLQEAIWHNAGEMGKDTQGRDKSGNGIDDDGNGYIDDFQGYDFSGIDSQSPDNDPSPRNDHGTLVASFAAAVGDNDRGIAGIGFGAKIMALKASDESPDPELLTGFEAILYAATMGAQIINCSWGDDNPSRAEQEVLDVVHREFNTLVIAASGNQGIPDLIFPASYRGVLSVSATGVSDEKANFSRYNYAVDLSAPGVDMYGATIGNRYKSDLGTSFAAPLVSGAAALVKKRYPTLDAEQFEEVLRASSDDISSSLDPVYIGKMGSGRLNILRAVTDGPNLVSARIVDYVLIDENGDGIADPGENISIRAYVKNILAPADAVTTELTPVSFPPLEITNSKIEMGAMATGQTIASPDGSFSFTVPDLTPNTELTLKMSVTTKDRSNLEFIVIRVAPTWATTDHNHIATTFNSVGNIGFDGFNTGEGDGLTLGSSKNLLFHGGLIAGVSPQRVSDVVRKGGFTQGASDGFQIVRPYRLKILSDSSVEIGTARFDDAHRDPASNVGLDVEMTTQEYRDPDLDNIVLINYRLRNATTEPLTNLHCGLYLDWDIGVNGVRDYTAYDSAYRMGYQQNVDAKPQYLVGAALLSDQSVDFHAFDNNDPIEGVDDFPPERKWAALSGGISRKNSGITDVSMLIGGGPMTLAPNDTVNITFALIVSENFQALRASVEHARELYKPSAVPERVDLTDAFNVRLHPNPILGAGRISFTLPTSGRTTIVAHDALGRVVRSLLDAPLEAGDHEIFFDATELPEGVYFYEIRCGGIARQGKLVKTGE